MSLHSRGRFVFAPLTVCVLLACCEGSTTGPPTPVLTTLVVTVTPPTLEVGGTANGAVSGRDQSGAPITVGPVVWSTAPPGIATVAGDGRVTGVAPGQTQLVAAASGRQGQALVTVVAAPPAAIPAVVSATTRATPLIGFNTNAHHSTANWTLPWFRDATAALNTAVLRYPGGTVANHWDWKTGWFQEGPTTPAQFANVTPKGTLRAEEFLTGTLAATAEPLLVLNVQHSTVEYEMEGLAHAESVGVPIRLVELGNEHNLAASFQAMPREAYAGRVGALVDAIGAAWPAAKICAVGGEPPSSPGWHAAILAAAPEVDALAFHVYLGAGNDDGVFDARRALGVPFAATGGLLDRYARAGFEDPSLPAGLEVWATEYNLGEVLAGAPRQHADTWTHALYVSAMSHLLMTRPRVTLLVNHNLTNTLDFAAIEPATGRITANGVAMMLLGQASKGLESAAELTFPGAPPVDHQGVIYPSLVGWRFQGEARVTAWVVNLSGEAHEVAFDQALGGSFSYELVSGDPELRVDGRESLVNAAGQSVTSVVLPAWSIAVLAGG